MRMWPGKRRCSMVVSAFESRTRSANRSAQSVSGGGSDFLDEDSYADRGGADNLHQWIGKIHVGGEDGLAPDGGGVNGGGGGGVDFFDVMAGAGDGDARRVSVDIYFAVGEI